MRDFGEQQERQRQQQLQERQRRRIAKAKARMLGSGGGGGAKAKGRTRGGAAAGTAAAAGDDAEAEFLLEDWQDEDGGDAEAGGAAGGTGGARKRSPGAAGLGLVSSGSGSEGGDSGGEGLGEGEELEVPRKRQVGRACPLWPCRAAGAALLCRCRRRYQPAAAWLAGTLWLGADAAATCCADHLCEPHALPADSVCWGAAPHAFRRRNVAGGAGVAQGAGPLAAIPHGGGRGLMSWCLGCS